MTTLEKRYQEAVDLDDIPGAILVAQDTTGARRSSSSDCCFLTVTYRQVQLRQSIWSAHTARRQQEAARS
jgi:hypothetical protein